MIASLIDKSKFHIKFVKENFLKYSKTFSRYYIELQHDQKTTGRRNAKHTAIAQKVRQKNTRE